MYPYSCYTPVLYGMPQMWPTPYPAAPSVGIDCLSRAHVEFANHMRMLWEQHVTWTRLAIVSMVFGLPDTQATVARLLQNAPDMGAALKPFYGQQAADTYAGLIKAHLTIAAELVQAAKAKDTAKANDARTRWYANADQIIDFLDRTIYRFPKEEFRKLFYHHLAMTEAEAGAMLSGDYTASIKQYDQIEREALEMANLISHAIMWSGSIRIRSLPQK